MVFWLVLSVHSNVILEYMLGGEDPDLKIPVSGASHILDIAQYLECTRNIIILCAGSERLKLSFLQTVHIKVNPKL